MKKAFLFFGSVFFLCSIVHAANGVDLGRIVVTPYRYAQALHKTAGNVSVITSEDIAGSNAGMVADVLRGHPGLSVRDYYGTGTKTVVDMAGFGEQAALNVLVLVDGRRVNDVDLSGVDWSQIPLEDVDIIEIVRGGTGGVLYGDNASSGVINIRTKKGLGRPRVNTSFEYGSYQKNVERLSVSGSTVENKLSYWFSLGRDAVQGYRENTFSRSNDFSARLSYDATDSLTVRSDIGVRKNDYGLPSALWQNHIDAQSRRFARYGRDHVNNSDVYYLVGITNDFDDLGVFDANISYREKDTDSFFLTSGLDTMRNLIRTAGFSPKHTLSVDLRGHENRLITGVDIYHTLYNSDNYSPSDDGVLKNYTNTNKTSLGVYAQDEFSVSDRLTAVAGFRYEEAEYSFGYHDLTGANPDVDQHKTQSMRAFNTGLVYAYKDNSSVFANVSRSFRFPEVDEFNYTDELWQKQLNTELAPQSSMNYELGVRHAFADDVTGGIMLFRMDVEDELYVNYLFDANGSKNENYGKTVHQGVETSLEYGITDRITMRGNYTYTDARFNDGRYDGNEIPLVARHKVSLGVTCLWADRWTWTAAGNYIGQRYALNDQANARYRVNGYVVVDTGLSFRKKDWTATLGVHNLFNKRYSEFVGYDRWTDERFYYPSPERNYTLKVDHRF